MAGSPYTWQIDHEACTILVEGRGAGTTADTLQLIAALQETLRECAGYRFLYDSVELHIESSPTDMMQVAEALFGRSRASFDRFAIVVPQARVQLARMFTALAHPHGINANVFTDRNDARRWLGLPEAEG